MLAHSGICKPKGADSGQFSNDTLVVVGRDTLLGLTKAEYADIVSKLKEWETLRHGSSAKAFLKLKDELQQTKLELQQAKEQSACRHHFLFCRCRRRQKI